MKFLLLTGYFPPENGSASHLFYELGERLIKWDHKVDVLTAFPSYHVDSGKLDTRYQKGFFLKETLAGMRVLRTRTFALPRAMFVLRGIDQFLTAALFFIRGFFVVSRPDAILVYSPPLPLGLTGWLLARIKRSRFILNVQDIFPQSAIDLGAMKNPWLIRFFRALERFIYRRADLVTVHSQGNRDYVASCGVSKAKIRVAHNWVDIDAIHPGPRVNGFRKEFGIASNAHVVSFAGVIGKSQDLDTVIEAARMLTQEKDMLFMIVGDGIEKARLQDRAKQLKLKNIKFLPMQPKAKYPEILSASDICLVTLHKEVRTPVVPSKLLGIMAAGRSVVASMPLAGDAITIIRDARCGVCVEPNNPAELARAIKALSQDSERSESFGRNGRDFAERHFSLNVCARQYVDWAKELQ